MADPNWANRTIWTGDNLDVMRGMNSESVDLIYLDPPFNSNRDYAAPIGSEAAEAAFKDTWTLNDVDLAWHGEIAESDPALYSVIDAAGLSRRRSMRAYLIMMSVRLLEMRRVLKPNGSIYLHCDPSADTWLTAAMDCVFGHDQLQQIITWKRTSAHNDRMFGSVRDTILYYAPESATQNPDAIRIPLDKDYVAAYYRLEDERGRYRAGDLTAAGERMGESGEPWRGIDPTKVSRHWAVPRRGGYADYLVRFLPSYFDIESSLARLDALDASGFIHWPAEPGGVPQLKRYLDASPGQIPTNLWDDIPPLGARARERVGYPTQKPLRLLERIILASSNPGDVVLDPFCGCATACVAAEKLDRQWAGIDLSPVAHALAHQRFQNELGLTSFSVTHRGDIPQRTDFGVLPSYKTHKHTLYGKQEGHCAGCRCMFPYRNMTTDHIVARSRGGTDHLDNLQLLCNACNSLKGANSQEWFVAELLSRGIRS